MKNKKIRNNLYFLIIIFITFLFIFFLFWAFQKIEDNYIYFPSETYSVEDFKSDPFVNFATTSTSSSSQEEAIYLKTISDLKYEFISEKRDFLEVNLSSRKVRLYRKGEPVKVAPILSIGDPQHWGGSPAGVYKILDGNRLSFSVVSNVYMPWALHYYGKYYIHGEPYYPGGKKIASSVSGGCIRLKNKDAKDIYELSDLDIPVLIIDKEKDHYQFVNKNLAVPQISARSYLIADLDSGFVLLEKNSQKERPIASLTKLMTAVVVSENVDLRKYITVKKEMLEAYGNTAGLKEGKKFRVVELFYPLLIESSNDAAEVLASYLGRARTIEEMNKKAKAILMEKTEFVDPHGFDRRNVSCARDLFQLARYISNVRPLIWKITKGDKVPSFGEIHFDIKNLWNKNIFIYDDSFIGGKTGYISQSGYNAIFVFEFMTDEKEIRKVIIVLLASKNLKLDTQRIYRWIRRNYSLLPVFKK